MQSDNPTVSVIIPTYNRAEFLADAINSVLDQKMLVGQSLEIIVVDDGSTDGTDAVVKKFGTRIRYYKIKHSGLPARARNFGIARAQADLVAFQDSDDFWLPDKLAKQLAVFDDPAVVLCYGNALIMEANGKPSRELIVPSSHLKSGDIFADLVIENFISTLTVIVRKSCLKKLGGFNESMRLRGLEDYELWLRLTGQKLGQVRAIKRPLARYRRHDQNVSLDSKNHPLEDIIFALETVRDTAGLQMSSNELRDLKQAIDRHRKNFDDYKKTSTPLVSIVMSVYNAGRYLTPAIESVLRQSYNNFEFIIIDDGSADNSWKTIKSFSDKRIKAFHQKNQGLQKALNFGISEAQGKYIARMDQDDISLPERIEKQVRFLEINGDIAIVGTNFPLINPRGEVISHSFYLDRSEDLKLEVFVRNPFGHGTLMIRRSAIEEVGSYNPDEPVEDYDLWWRIMKRFNGSNLLEELYKWRVVPSSMSHSASDKRQVLIHNLIKKIWLETPLPSVSSEQIQSGIEHYSQHGPEYAGQFMFMLSALSLGAFKMRRYKYSLSLMIKLVRINRLFLKTLRDMRRDQLSHEYLLVHVHPN